MMRFCRRRTNNRITVMPMTTATPSSASDVAGHDQA
jgi:hypothetical protein